MTLSLKTLALLASLRRESDTLAFLDRRWGQ